MVAVRLVIVAVVIVAFVRVALSLIVIVVAAIPVLSKVIVLRPTHESTQVQLTAKDVAVTTPVT